MGVLCLSVCFSWLIRGGVTPTTGPISSPSLGRVKWKEISVKMRKKLVSDWMIQLFPGVKSGQDGKIQQVTGTQTFT